MMRLEDLARRLDHERDGELADAEIVVMSPGGRRYEILSVNWESERKTWLIVTDRPAPR
jgi:hypothetical protein